MQIKQANSADLRWEQTIIFLPLQVTRRLHFKNIILHFTVLIFPYKSLLWGKQRMLRKLRLYVIRIFFWIFWLQIQNCFHFESRAYWETRKAFWSFLWLGRRRLKPGVWDCGGTERRENQAERGKDEFFFFPFCGSQKMGNCRGTRTSVVKGSECRQKHQ